MPKLSSDPQSTIKIHFTIYQREHRFLYDRRQDFFMSHLIVNIAKNHKSEIKNSM